ncbi:hypothetical protein ACFXAZ_12140 [Streptomyces sp. NPDC059477]|uniref:hypothetical protein n=1 Tax=Streptomyces sp. NPDC059477 TaxID=3346847 RepID=UPI0036C2E3DD
MAEEVYDAPAEEPDCFTHHSSICGCGPHDAAPEGYSTEPPFPPGYRPPGADDVLMEPRNW